MMNGQLFGYTNYRASAILSLDENKIIDNIEMKIVGYDSQGGSFYAIIRDIVLFGVSK